jgi:ammonia channel protein AmtB
MTEALVNSAMTPLVISVSVYEYAHLVVITTSNFKNLLPTQIATQAMGPRRGRFDENGKPVDMPGHSIPMAAMGGFILLFGFLAFNGGSQVKRKKLYKFQKRKV